MKALGLLEVCGYATALLCVDSMAKAADIKLVTIDFNKPGNAQLEKIPLLAQVKIIGSVSNVKMALESGYNTALKYNNKDEIISHLIPSYHEDLYPLMTITKIKKKNKEAKQ